VQNTAFSVNKTLNIKGRLIDLSTPLVMGIVNVTPDSFYDGGRYNSDKDLLEKVSQMVTDGASIIDVGGYSTRPGAPDISSGEENERVIPAIRAIRKEFPMLLISIDSFRSEVARAAIGEGADLINDVSGGSLDVEMFKTVAALHVPYILMHMKGNPQNMTKQTDYKDLVKEVIDHLQKKIYSLHELGVKDVIVDPGFGFAKTREQNFELLNQLHLLQILEKPILTGLSRKSMIWKTLSVTPEEALNGTTVLHTIAVAKGATILRVHDVKEAVEVVTLMQRLQNS
jgi:dihydropteroate synthase